jgi:hypothetical protein
MTITSGLDSVFSPSWASGTIPAGGSQQVINRFAPTVAQNYSGTVTVNGDQTSGTNTIAISGTGLTSAPAIIQSSGQGSWTMCDPISGNCWFSASIQNVGSGCAAGTTVVLRLFDGNGAQLGSDVQMGAIGTSLSAKTIRPQEVVAIQSLTFIGPSVSHSVQGYLLFPTWNNVACA